MAVALKDYPTLYGDANLVSYYTMDGNANDSKASNNATLYGSPSFVAGSFGQALSLNGSTQYGIINPHVGLDSLGDFTLSAIVYLNSGWSAAGTIYGYNNNYDSYLGGAYTNLSFRIKADRTVELSFRVAGTYTFYAITSTDTIPTQTPTRVTFTRSGSTWNLYIGKTLSITASRTNGACYHVGAKGLGCIYDYRTFDVLEKFNGWIDDFPIFSRAISGTELANWQDAVSGSSKFFQLFN